MYELFLASAIAGVALLWRNFRYDEDLSINTTIDRMPYLLRKPITCGLCVTFWIAGIASVLFAPFSSLAATLPYRFALPHEIAALLEFGAQWMVLGVLSVAIVYIIDTFFQVSHYYKHKSHG